MKRKQLARRKMARVVDELYTTLFMAGAHKVDMSLERQETGLRLTMSSDFAPDSRHHLEEMARLLQPEERDPALVKTYWELAGEDLTGSDSEIALVGQMIDEAQVEIDEEQVRLCLTLRYN